ncbi:MAG: arginase family protein [Actinomycetota bacterium]|nr:arginase family protein [Actinomycetota bacterium]
MSRLRAKCPDCLTFTAVAMGPDYQCHSCGREWASGLVRVPRAWGDGGEAMAASAALPLSFPEAAVIEEPTLGEQNLVLATELPERPVVLGGCCCSHVGAIEGLAARHDRLAVVWLDAHGDLNTAETSPSGNLWGMPLRMAIDSGAVDPGDVALIGARNLDPPEEEFITRTGIHTSDDAADRALDGVSCVYVALDCDVLDEGEVPSFMPEPGGLSVDEVDTLFKRLSRQATVVGAGLTGLRPEPLSIGPLERLTASLGL